MGKIYRSADELIGNTPLLQLNNIERNLGLNAHIYGKLEYLSLAGSAKDRPAKYILDDAEEKGFLHPGSIIIEPTSGNTGIGLAAVAAAKGYHLIIVMPDNMSIERQKLIKAYGAEIVLTDSRKGMPGAIAKAEELKKSHSGSIIAGQFTNPANPISHYETTGPEIWEDLNGEIDYFVAGVGTGGTITGTGQFLRSKNPDIHIAAVEPETSAVLSGGVAGAHDIPGLGSGFIPEVLDTSVYDEIMAVSDSDALKYGKIIAKQEGVLVGISSGAALCAAVQLAEREECKGKNIVVLLPDSGDRYFSTRLFEDE